MWAHYRGVQPTRTSPYSSRLFALPIISAVSGKGRGALVPAGPSWQKIITKDLNLQCDNEFMNT